MTLVLLVASALLGLLAWPAWELGLSHRNRAAQAADRRAEVQRRQELDAERRRARIVRNPVNGILEFLWDRGPERVRIGHPVKVAESERDRARDRVQAVVRGFRGGTEPDHAHKTLLLLALAAWVVAFCCQFWLDLPVFRALADGNLWFAVFLTGVVVTALASASLLLDLTRRSLGGDLRSTPRGRGALVAVLCFLLLVIAVLALQAPRRADALYDDAITLKRAQVIAAQSAGDGVGQAAYQNQLDALEAKKHSASATFQQLTVVAAVAEFCLGLWAVGGLQVLQLAAARRRLTHAERVLLRAEHVQEARQAEITRDLTQDLMSAGAEPEAVNTALQQHTAGAGGSATPAVGAPRGASPAGPAAAADLPAAADQEQAAPSGLPEPGTALHPRYPSTSTGTGTGTDLRHFDER